MNDHLKKAKAAMEAAGELEVDLSQNHLPIAYTRLLDLASIQARIAEAEVLERLADHVCDSGSRWGR